MKLRATSFATRQDLAAFAKAVTHGKTAKEALSFGDNGIGAWGTSTWDPKAHPMCALPSRIGHAYRPFKITLPNDRSVIAECTDISPPGVVDLNPAALLLLGFDADADINIPDVDVIPA